MISLTTNIILQTFLPPLFYSDRLRTCVNICGDAVGCAFVQALVERNKSVHPMSKDSFPPPLPQDEVL
uniref:Amino acid transporter n=1 Tax=Panagrolaimus superbus TaxID=310955 RepID=A0A914Z5X8_9BILA